MTFHSANVQKKKKILEILSLDFWVEKDCVVEEMYNQIVLDYSPYCSLHAMYCPWWGSTEYSVTMYE